MVSINVTYEGELHTVARHGPSGCELTTDAPTDNEGRGESFSPTDLVATAIGTCMLTVMGIVARRHSWPLEGARADVKKKMATSPVRRIGALQIRIDMPEALDSNARIALEKAGLSCPVHKSLHEDVLVDVEFVYG